MYLKLKEIFSFLPCYIMDNARDKDGCQPTHGANSSSHLEIIKGLVSIHWGSLAVIYMR